MSDKEPHLTTREFDNFREDTKEHFKIVHECDQRIEDKIDKIAETINPLLADYKAQKEKAKKHWDVRLLILGSAIGLVFSIATAVTLYALSIGG